MNFKTTKSIYQIDFSIECSEVNSVIYYSPYNYENSNIILPINYALSHETERLIPKKNIKTLTDTFKKTKKDKKILNNKNLIELKVLWKIKFKKSVRSYLQKFKHDINILHIV